MAQKAQNARARIRGSNSAEIYDHAHPSDRASDTTRRGADAWTYIYVMLAIALAIEVAAFETTPIPFPYDIAALVIVVLGTSYLFLASRWFQGKLLAGKAHYEGKFR
jgi:hypothetical protein